MTDNEKLSCLIDRPCTACKFHKENGCSKWSCVFEEKSDVPGREKGTWQYVTHYGDRYRHCPFCHCEKKEDNSTGWNFCQYCGADMRGGKE